MADSTIDGLPTIGSIDRTADKIPIWDNSSSLTGEMTIDAALGFSGGNPVSTSDTQTLSNKTLGNSNVLTVRDDRLTLQDSGDTTKQAAFQLSGITTGTTRTFTLPDATTTLVGTDATQTLTNKTLTSPTINTATISNPTLTVDTVSEYTAANGVTIDGLLIKDGLLPAGNVKPNQLQSGTGTTWVYQTWSPSIASSSGGAPALGNGVVVARYAQVGKMVNALFKITLGTTTNFGTGVVYFSLPVAAQSDWTSPTFMGTAHFEDTGTAAYGGWVALASSTQFQFTCHDTVADGRIVYISGSGGVPFAWGSTDVIECSFSYEAA